jgi:hypothetical protein
MQGYLPHLASANALNPDCLRSLAHCTVCRCVGGGLVVHIERVSRDKNRVKAFDRHTADIGEGEYVQERTLMVPAIHPPAACQGLMVAPSS